MFSIKRKSWWLSSNCWGLYCHAWFVNSKIAMIDFHRLCIQKYLAFTFQNLNNFSRVHLCLWLYCLEDMASEICMRAIFFIFFFWQTWVISAKKFNNELLLWDTCRKPTAKKYLLICCSCCSSEEFWLAFRC